jgi:hypothetical protein
VEQNPIVYLLLKDGLARLSEVNPDEASKFELVFADAETYLSSVTSAPSVGCSQAHFVGAPSPAVGHPSIVTSAPAVGATMYFDFMFVDKKAKSNKDMFFLKHITQNDPKTDIDKILNLALQKKPERCVLKAKSYMGTNLPKHIYEGSTIKYFIF